MTTKLYLTFFGQNAVTKVSTSKKISRLLDNKEDHKEYFEAAIEIISICNRAAHGEKIDNPTTIKTLLLGIEILSYFYGMLQGYMDALAGS